MDEICKAGEAVDGVAKPRIIVHLVHGTWPYGWFRRAPLRHRRHDREPEWFEEGSEFQSAVRDLTGRSMRFSRFCWSGRNTFADRDDAAFELAGHLSAARAKHPHAEHVIIAHSHGGTVAAAAVSDSYWLCEPRPVSALICLATPFAFLTYASRHKDKSVLPFAIATIASATIALGLLFVADLSPIPWWLLIPAHWLIHTSVSYLIVFDRVTKPEWLPPCPRNDIAVFSLRTMRDEAALAIGMGQALQWFSHGVYRLFDEAGSADGTGRRVAAATLVGLFGLIGYGLVSLSPDAAGLDAGQRMALAIPVGALAPALVLVSCQAVLAAVTGLERMRLWPHLNIEVDVVPPDAPTQVKSYPYHTEPADLRHGLYRNERVQVDIAEILRCVADGEIPRLLSGDEVDDRLAEKAALART